MPYSPEEKQHALDRLRANGSIKQTSRETGVSVRTLKRWQSEPAAQPDTHNPKPDKRDTKPDTTLPDDVLGTLETYMATHALALAKDLLNDDIQQPAPLNQRATALGMLFDRLLKLDARRAGTAAPDDEPIVQQIVFRDVDGRVYGMDGDAD